MHGHQGYAVVVLHGVVQIRVQGHAVQKARQGGDLRAAVQKADDAGAQLLYVLNAATALHVALLLQGLHVPGLLAHRVVELRQVQRLLQCTQLPDQRCKVLQLAGRRLEGGVRLRAGEDLPQILPLLDRQLGGPVHSGAADAPGGDVDDPPQAQVVHGVVDDAQIGQHVLDLQAVKELHAAVDLVGDAVALEGHFQGVGLSVHPVEDGAVLPGAAPAVALQNLARHVVGLVALVEHGLHQHFLPGSRLGP